MSIIWNMLPNNNLIILGVNNKNITFLNVHNFEMHYNSPFNVIITDIIMWLMDYRSWKVESKLYINNKSPQIVKPLLKKKETCPMDSKISSKTTVIKTVWPWLGYWQVEHYSESNSLSVWKLYKKEVALKESD